MYLKSVRHLENCKNARILGNIKIQKLKEERKKEYNKNPKLCFHCKKPLVYEKKKNKFCCSSCAAIFNNKNRSDDFITEEFKEKQRNNAIKGFNKRKREQPKRIETERQKHERKQGHHKIPGQFDLNFCGCCFFKNGFGKVDLIFLKF